MRVHATGLNIPQSHCCAYVQSPRRIGPLAALGKALSQHCMDSFSLGFVKDLINLDMSRPTITDVAFDEMFPRMAQYGYRHVMRIRDELNAIKSAASGPLTAHIAQVGGQPPLFMVKGPLFHPSELRGQPQVEFVVTVTQSFPNSYPIMTVEGPPQGWAFKRHPNVDTNGCCFLRGVSSWDPRRSKIVDCFRELQQAFRANHPFQQVGAPPVAHVPAPAQAQSAAPQPSAPPPPPQQQPQPPQQQDMPPALGIPIPMPQQTLVMGQVIFGATNAASSRTDAEMERQRERDRQQLAEFQRRQQSDPANRVFANAVANFHQVIKSGASAAGTVVECPLGFGLRSMMTGPDQHHPLKSPEGVPPPLPPCTDPTPDEQYKRVEQQRTADRTQRESNAHSQPKGTSAFGSLSRALNIGAAAVSNLASQAASSVESEVRKSEAAAERRRFVQFFPQFAGQEELIAEYPCWALMGSGAGVPGAVYITNMGVHFTSKRADNAPVPLVFSFDMAYQQVASVVKGSALNFEWLHLMYDDGLFRSLFNVTTSTAANIGGLVSASINGSPYSRMYNWVDHKWRAVRFGGRQGGPPPPPPTNPLPPMPPLENEQCSVCMDRPKNQFFQPCGHVCCCQLCAQQVKECPMCRAPIQQSFQAFL